MSAAKTKKQLRVNLTHMAPARVGPGAAVVELLDSARGELSQNNVPDAGWLAAAADLLVGAAVHQELALADALHEALAELDRELAGPSTPPELMSFRSALAALGAVANGARARARSAGVSFAPNSEPAQILAAIGDRPGISNSEIGDVTGLGFTRVSRGGRRLVESGLAWPSRLGRFNAWELTPRGEATYRQLKETEDSKRSQRRGDSRRQATSATSRASDSGRGSSKRRGTRMATSTRRAGTAVIKKTTPQRAAAQHQAAAMTRRVAGTTARQPEPSIERTTRTTLAKQVRRAQRKSARSVHSDSQSDR